MVRSLFAAFAAVATLVLLVAAPVDGAAQIRIVPQVGAWTPLSDLPSASDAVEIGERDATLAFGAAVELGLPVGTTFRVGVLHGTGSEVPIDDFGCTDCARSTVTTLTAAVVLRPLDLVVVSPYVLLGGGLRRVDFDREELEAEEFDALFSTENDFAGHVGIGAEIGLGGLGLTVELSDVISSLSGPDDESEIQHDVFLMVGLGIG